MNVKAQISLNALTTVGWDRKGKQSFLLFIRGSCHMWEIRQAFIWGVLRVFKTGTAMSYFNWPCAYSTLQEPAMRQSWYVCVGGEGEAKVCVFILGESCRIYKDVEVEKQRTCEERNAIFCWSLDIYFLKSQIFQRRCTNGQQVHENRLSISNHLGNTNHVNRKHNEISLNNC